MENKIFFIWILAAFAVILLATNTYLVLTIFNVEKVCEQQKINAKVLAFRNMFTEKILLTSGDIDFDTRMILETTVRELNDPEIFSQWQKFTKSADKEEATYQAKSLLRLLIEKTPVK